MKFISATSIHCDFVLWEIGTPQMKWIERLVENTFEQSATWIKNKMLCAFYVCLESSRFRRWLHCMSLFIISVIFGNGLFVYCWSCIFNCTKNVMTIVLSICSAFYIRCDTLPQLKIQHNLSLLYPLTSIRPFFTRLSSNIPAINSRIYAGTRD